MKTIMKRENGHEPATHFSGLVDQVFQGNLNRFFDDDFWGFNGLRGQTNVPVNMRETDQGFELELVAPGLKKENFKLSVNGDVLMVSSDHKDESQQEDKNEGWMRKEYKMNSFVRSFKLDDTVDGNRISAVYNDGILCVTLPKKEGVQRVSRTIDIQ